MFDAVREYHSTVIHEVRRGIEELKTEMPEEMRRVARVNYLKEKITDMIVSSWNLMHSYDRYVRRDRTVERFLVGEDLHAMVAGILKLQGEIRRTMRPEASQGKGGLTAEMIERARAFNFPDLYPFSRNMARCPFHDDKTPSMSLKNNRARCWGCNESWDPIAFVMKKEGLTFVEAVRSLQ